MASHNVDAVDAVQPRGVAEKHHLLASSEPVKHEPANVLVQSVPASDSDTSSQTADVKAAQWMPFAIRWYFLIIPVSLAAVLALLVMVLHWLSDKHDGLGSESSAVVGWKYVPTLIAIVYTQLVAMVLGAMRRTEPFARLAKPVEQIPVARYTLLEKSKPWWTTFVHGLQRRRNPGARGWAIVLSSFVFILSVLGISPLSAALLTTRDVQVRSSAELSRLSFDGTAALSPQIDRTTFLRVTGALLQNYTTSPWVNDEYFITPFWPKDSSKTQWNFNTPTPQTWEAETTVFRNEFVCSALETKKKDVYLRHFLAEFEADMYKKAYMASVLLESTDGCRLNLTFNATSNTEISSVEFRRHETFASWSDITQVASRNELDRDARIILNDECEMDELILMTTPWMVQKVRDAFLPNATISAYACRSEHTMAKMPVRASSTWSGVSLDFDKERFQQIREKVPPSIFNTSKIHDFYSSPEWYEYLPQPSLVNDYITGDVSPPLHGGAALLGTKYNFNITEMMADPDLPQKAARMRRMFFAELLRTTADDQVVSQGESISGMRVAIERRILVNSHIAITLCVLFALSFCCLTALLWLSRLTNRPLHLRRDPSSILGLCAMVTPRTSVLDLFKPLDLVPRKALKTHLAARTAATSSSRGLYEVTPGRDPDLTHSHHESTKPSTSALPALRLRNLFGLLLYVLALLTSVAVLFKFARMSTLHQQFFVYRAKVDLFGEHASISPFAIIPTFFAMTITLWWDSIEQACRTLQPYLAMSHDTGLPSDGIALSYASSFWILASLKAAKHRHWLLSLITFTTFLMQALTIAMSALFQQSSVSMPQTHILNNTLEVRRDPLLAKTWLTYGRDMEDAMFYRGNPAERVGTMLAEAFGGLENNWLYTAMLQAALQGPEPSWSRDGWSFVPLDLSSLTRSVNNRGRTTEQQALPSNLTVRTTGVRGRVDCSVVEDLEPEKWVQSESGKMNSTTFTQAPFANGTMNSTLLDTIYYLNASLSIGNVTTDLTPMVTIPECCFNVTDPEVSTYSLDMDVALAYWTENKDNSTLDGFTTKWVQGRAGFRDIGPFSQNPRMVFAQPPAIQALSCVPYFETVDAEVTVDQGTGIVNGFEILDKPTPDLVAQSDYFELRRSNETYSFHNATETRRFYHNITTSYGSLFMKSILHAACLENLNLVGGLSPSRQPTDYLFDKIFNMRDNSTGINADFMSYATLAQVGHNPAALLDPDVLLRETQKVFAIFFQHYVSSTVSLQTGGWGYQSIGSDLKVEAPIPNETSGRAASKFEDFPQRNTPRTVTATLYTQVEVLQMNTVAFAIAISIMVWLVLTILIFAAMQRRFLGPMQRNIECIADVLVLIAGSEHLLAAVEEKGIDTIIAENILRTRLGWFRDLNGTMRWRIEVVENQGSPRPISLGQYSPVPVEEGGNLGRAVPSAEGDR